MQMSPDRHATVARYRVGEPTAKLVEQPPLPEGVTPFEMLRF